MLKSGKFILIIIIFSIILSIPLINSNLDVYCDDGIQHISRAYATYLSIKNNENSNVLLNLGNNFGYSWNLFYGEFSTILILICKIIAQNFIIAYKIALFIGLLLSGLTMYGYVSNKFNSKEIGVISAIFYLSMPYHLNDMYIRNAFGEFLSFIFIPLVFWGIDEILNNKNKKYIFVLGVSGLIFTHNLMTVFTAIFSIIYLIFNYKKINKKVILDFCINCIIILVITASFWIPLLETMNFSEYAVYQKNVMATAESVKQSGLNLKQLFFTKQNSIYVFEIGWVCILAIIGILFIFKNIKGKKDYTLFLILGIFCAFMSTKYFPWQFVGKIFEMIQFPWRMMTFVNFFLSIICGINIYLILKKLNMIDIIVICSIIIIELITLYRFLPIDTNLINIENMESENVSTNTWQAMVGMGKGEYFPQSANNNREYLSLRKDNIYILNGNANIEFEHKKGQFLNSKIKVLEKNTVLELPYIYYPGYKICVDNIETNYFESDNGFILIYISGKGEHDISVCYPGTFGMRVSKYVSIIGSIVFIGYIIVKKKLEKHIETNIS